MMSSHGHSLLAFLLVDYKHVMDGVEAAHVTLSRLERMKNVHEVIGHVFEPLAKNALRGIRCKTIDNKIVHLHFVLGS